MAKKGQDSYPGPSGFGSGDWQNVGYYNLLGNNLEKSALYYEGKVSDVIYKSLGERTMVFPSTDTLFLFVLSTNIVEGNSVTKPNEKEFEQILSTFRFVNQTEGLSEKCFNELTTSSQKQEDYSKPYGIISGRVYFPGQGIPSGTSVCAYEVNKAVRYCNSNYSNQEPNYEIKVSEGKYYVYLLRKEDLQIGVGAPDKMDDYQFFKDENNNNRYAPLLIDLKTSEHKKNIDIGDDIIGSQQFYNDLYCPDILQI